MKPDLIFWIFFIIQKYLIFSDETEFLCLRETPLLVINSENNECIYDRYNVIIHKISNEIIKIQWLNKQNELGKANTWYMGYDISSKGDLIIESFIFNFGNQILERFYYGIKSNGRSFFYDQNKFINQITLIPSNTTVKKFENEFIRIRLTNDDNKDYYLSASFDDNAIEIIDFYNNKVNTISLLKIFDYSTWASLIYSILELKNEDKTYMFCFIGIKDNYNYISLQKFKFNNPDISQDNSYSKIAFSPQNQEFQIKSSSTITCFEIQKYNIIQCFYLNINNYYTIGLFKEDTLDFIYSEIIDETPLGIEDNNKIEIFYRNINLKNEISILAYMLSKHPDIIYIQLKNLIYNNFYLKYELEDYLIRFKKIEIEIQGETNYNSFFYLSDLKKINDNKFVLISSVYYSDYESSELYLILFDIYNFHDTNLLIRYYFIPMKLYDIIIYRFLMGVNYNGFLGLIYDINFIRFSSYQKFSLFSYINSTDSELINLGTNTVLKLSNYISNENIENNIFGVELYGIKIVKLPNSTELGVYFY